MKTNIRAIAAVLLIASASFLAGAMSDSLVKSVAESLLYRAGNERNYAEWFGPNMGAPAPVAEAYFRGRAEGFEAAAELLVNANTYQH